MFIYLFIFAFIELIWILVNGKDDEDEQCFICVLVSWVNDEFLPLKYIPLTVLWCYYLYISSYFVSIVCINVRSNEPKAIFPRFEYHLLMRVNVGDEDFFCLRYWSNRWIIATLITCRNENWPDIKARHIDINNQWQPPKLFNLYIHL